MSIKNVQCKNIFLLHKNVYVMCGDILLVFLSICIFKCSGVSTFHYGVEVQYIKPATVYIYIHTLLFNRQSYV